VNGIGGGRPVTKAELVRLRRELALAQESLELLENKRDVLIARGMELLRESARLRRELTPRWARIEKLWGECLAREGRKRLRGLCGGQRFRAALEGRERAWMSVRLVSIRTERSVPAPLGAVFDCGPMPDQVRGMLAALLPDLLHLMTLETNVRRIASALRRCQHQVNALDFVLLPELKAQQHRIELALEEKEREALFQVKRMKSAGR